MGLESAIPPHLRQDRVVPSSLSPGFEPPFPAYCARFPEKTTDLAVAYLGAQDRTGADANVKTTISKIIGFVEKCPATTRPAHFDLAAVTDNSGAYNETVIAYWTSRDGYATWAQESGFDAWFDSINPSELGQTGVFKEILLPSMDRFETVFSDNAVPEGAAHLRESVSGMLQEHVYWGSMRDRLPASQVDVLEGRKWKPGDKKSLDDTLGKKVAVQSKENLAIIRSGQDWSNTKPEERKLYLDTMHPVLTKAMHFLRDSGREVGCFSCRFMDVLPSATSPTVQSGSGTEKTFGLAYFDDLESLEKWSKSHKTHLDIFGGFRKYAAALNNEVSLRLFHEVVVLEPSQQVWEYVNCHGETGMLASL